MTREVRLLAEFVASGGPPTRRRSMQAAAAVRDTVGVMLAGAASLPRASRRRWPLTKAPASAASLGTSIATSAALGGARQRRRGARARLRRHVLRLAGASELRAGSRGSCRRRTRARADARTLLDAYVVGFELECRLGDVMNPRHYHSAAGTARRRSARSARRPPPRACSGSTPHATRARARHRGLVGVRAEGEHRQHGEAAARRHGRAQRPDGGAARAARVHRERRTRSTDRRAISPRWTASSSALDGAVADLGARWEILRDRGDREAVSLVRRDASAARRAARDASGASGSTADRGRGDRRGGRLDDAAAADSSTIRRPASRPSSACRSAPRGRCRLPAHRHRHVRRPRRFATLDVQALMPRVTLRANAAFDAAAPLSQARVTVRLRDGRVLARRPTARAAIRGGPDRGGAGGEVRRMCAARACRRRRLTGSVGGAQHGRIAALDDIRASAEEYPVTRRRVTVVHEPQLVLPLGRTALRASSRTRRATSPARTTPASRSSSRPTSRSIAARSGCMGAVVLLRVCRCFRCRGVSPRTGSEAGRWRPGHPAHGRDDGRVRDEPVGAGAALLARGGRHCGGGRVRLGGRRRCPLVSRARAGPQPVRVRRHGRRARRRRRVLLCCRCSRLRSPPVAAGHRTRWRSRLPLMAVLCLVFLRSAPPGAAATTRKPFKWRMLS